MLQERTKFGEYVKHKRGVSLTWLEARSGVNRRKLTALSTEHESRLWFHEAIAISTALDITLDDLAELLPATKQLAERIALERERELHKRLYG